MAVIGVDSYAPSPAAIGSSAISPVTAAAGQAAATAAAAPAPATGQAGPQPLNTTGPLGTSVNIVT